MQNTTFWTLLYFQEVGSDSDNLRVNTKAEQHELYVKNVENLSSSLARFGHRLVVLTNDRSYLLSICQRLDTTAIEAVEGRFELQIPPSLRFNAAHRKFEVFRYFAERSDAEYNILLDCDVTCIRPFPPAFLAITARHLPICYEITAQVTQAYGQSRISEEFSMFSDFPPLPTWLGGELIGGDSRFYKLLYDRIMFHFEMYVNAAPRLHHQGDEFLTSLAVQELCQRGENIIDAGALGIIVRYWDAKTKHTQYSLEYALSHSLIHLPNGKEFLALERRKQRTVTSFRLAYRRHQITRRLLALRRRILRW